MPKVSSTVLPRTKVAKKSNAPVWAGPSGDGPNGGITFSALSRFLSCPERFRVRMIEAIRPRDKFSHRMEYGQMWHACEEALAGKKDWKQGLPNYTVELARKYPMDQEQISHWYNVCRTQFPLYIDFWKKQKDVLKKVPIFQEKVFDVPYLLPSGRTVRLRGKFDAVDTIGSGKDAKVYLFETKTKSEIDENKIHRQLKFDCQTMLYLIALSETHKPAGVRYNVIRRPLAGGKGSIRPHQATKTKAAETDAEFYERLKGVILEDVGSYFLRMKVEVYQSDIDRFKKMCLNPLLEQLCDWYEQCKWGNAFDGKNNIHFMSPFGIFNPLVELGQTDLDSYLETGNMAGLQRVETLFTELQ